MKGTAEQIKAVNLAMSHIAEIQESARRIADLIRRMEQIRDVGIVNAREDTRTISEAIDMLRIIERIAAESMGSAIAEAVK